MRQKNRKPTEREPSGRRRSAAAAEQRKFRGYLPAAVLVLVSIAAVLVAVFFFAREDGGTEGISNLGGNAASAAGHVHGLGIDPDNGALFVASHNGLFQAGPGETRARPVGTAGQDVMGFSVVGPNHLLGSGHPGEGQEDLPSNLGLIESRDGGRTFRPVSLIGEVDFHVLRSAGSTVYGSDSSSGRFLVSRDGGRSWSEQEPPGPLFDLAINPVKPDRLVASTDSGLFSSTDAGRNWRRVGEKIALVAWSRPDRLYLTDAEGGVALSSDGGRTFRPTGKAPGQAVAFVAAGQDLFVALEDNSVQQSSDGGATWRPRAQV